MLFPSHQNPDKNNLTQYKIRGQVLNLKANTEYEAIVSCNVAFGVTDEARIKILTDVIVCPHRILVHTFPEINGSIDHR